MKITTLKTTILGLLFLLINTNTFAGIEYAHFVHFGANQGLASNKVLCVEPDPEGHLWIATDFGIDRFNGKTFKHYQGDGYPVLKQEFVHNIKYIGDGKIEACGQYNFLQEYDIATDSFSNKMPEIGGKEHITTVLSSYIAPDGNRYIQTNSMGIFQYNKTTDNYENITSHIDELKNTFIGALFVDDHGNKWVGTIGTVYVYSPSWERIFSYSLKDKQTGAITNIKSLGNDKIAVTCYSNEIWIFDIKNIKSGPRTVHLPFNNANGILYDKSGRVWIGSDGDGLWYTANIFKENPDFTEVRPFNSSNNEISKIYAMAEDVNGNIWLGTYNRGIWGYMKQQNNLVYFSEQKGFPTAVCTGFHTDKNKNLWVATDGNGIYEITENFQQIKQYDFDSKNLTSLQPGKGKDEVLAATWGAGIISFNTQTKQQQRVQFGALGKGINYMSSASVLSNGDVWVCTTGDGLYQQHNGQWSKKVFKGGVNTPFEDLWPRKLVEGKDSTLWIVSSNTLWHVNGAAATDLIPDLTQQKSKHPMFVLDALLLPDGDLLAATNKSIIHVSADGKHIDTLSYLPVSTYNTLLADNDGNIWTASSDGVLKINLKKKSYKKMPGANTNSSRYEFFPQAGYKDREGRLFFGTNNGFLCYNTEGAYSGSPISHFALEDLYINSCKVKPYTGVLGDGPLNRLEALTLSHNQTNISIELDLVDFEELNRASIQYRLIGLHDNWISLEQGQPILFNHLPQGDYTLEVMATRANNVNEKVLKRLEISVLPPWWSSWWFKLLVLGSLISIIGITINQRYKRMKETQQLLTATVNERTKELKNTLAEKNRLISVVAHDLKNPMFAIVSSLGSWISKNKAVSNENQHKAIIDIYNSASILQNEMQKLLDWVQSDKVSSAITLEPINIHGIIRNVVSLLEKQINMKGLTLKTAVNLNKCVLADSKTLEIVIRNLINNSIKFTPRGGVIEIKATETAEKAMIEISDNGVGIEKDVLKKLTENNLYISSDGTEKEKGTGMGIGLCHTYIKKNNGSMHINSKPGVGTSICITLPLSDVEARHEEAATYMVESHNAPEIEFDGTLLEGNTLLLIDDDDLIRRTMNDVLGKYANTIMASNGEEGLNLAKDKQPDIIISDVSMPVMNGLEMSKALNEDASTRHIPLLFISANNEEEDRISGLKSGAVDYIVKPFSLTELLFKLNNLLELRRNLQQSLLEKLMKEQSKHTENNHDSHEHDETEATVEMAPDLKRFMDLLEKNYKNYNLQIEELAREMCISQSTMSRRIKTLSGKTPVELLSNYRLNKAKALLLKCKKEGEDIQIAEIAIQVGFSDPSYFTRRFKDYFGVTPTQVTD